MVRYNRDASVTTVTKPTAVYACIYLLHWCDRTEIPKIQVLRQRSNQLLHRRVFTDLNVAQFRLRDTELGLQFLELLGILLPLCDFIVEFLHRRPLLKDDVAEQLEHDTNGRGVRRHLVKTNQDNTRQVKSSGVESSQFIRFKQVKSNQLKSRKDDPDISMHIASMHWGYPLCT